jgi:hypothetical protein
MLRSNGNAIPLTYHKQVITFESNEYKTCVYLASTTVTKNLNVSTYVLPDLKFKRTKDGFLAFIGCFNEFYADSRMTRGMVFFQ